MTGLKYDAKKIKSSLSLQDYEKIIEALGIPVVSKTDKTWTLMTGCHHKIPMDGSPKLLFYTDTRIFICLTHCQCARDIFSLVQSRLRLLGQGASFIEAVDFIITVVGLTDQQYQRIDKPNVCNWQDGLEKFVRFRSGDCVLQIYDKAVLEGIDKIYPLNWIKEGISCETMAKYQIGYYVPSQCTTIPCFDREGNLIGVRGRFWSPEEIEMGKYRPLTLLDGTTYKFPTNNVFFGINWNWENIERTGVVTLVEGEKSVLKADTFYGRDSNVLALYGSQLGMKRRNQLVKMGVKEVNLALDSDYREIGDEDFKRFHAKMLSIGKMFQGFAKVYVLFNNLGLDGYKCSPFDFDKATFERMFESRKEIRL